MKTFSIIALLTHSLLLNSELVADDWPQILGPNRNGVASGESLLEAWPKEGPKQIWNRECGQGYAGVSVKNDRVYLYHRIKKKDIVECLAAVDGATIWKVEFDAVYRGGMSNDLGPRCVPQVHGDSLYCYGAAGVLRRLSLKDGKEQWSENLFEKFKANEGYFGAGSAPLIVDEKIIVVVGGRKAGIVGLNLNGETAWTTEADTASYSAPISLEYKGKSCAACVSKYFLKLVDVADGSIIAQQEFGKRGPTVNAAAPLHLDNQLFLTASYNIGGRMLNLDSLEVAWENDTSMSSQYTTCIFHEGHMYGCHGREDQNNGELRCVRISDGKVIWRAPGSGLGHLIKVENQILFWNIKGELKLIRLSTDGVKLIGKSNIFYANSKSLPALSNGRLFVKSNGDYGQGKLVCLQVGK